MDKNTIVIDENIHPGDWILLHKQEIIAHSHSLIDVLKAAKKLPQGETKIVPILLGQASYY